MEVALRLDGARRFALSRWGVVFALTGAAGIALRVWTYRSVLGIPDSDEAVSGLMTMHAMHGQFTTFFWGSPYGGSQEDLLTVPVFWIGGIGYLTLRLVPIVLTALTSLLLWRVGRRTIGEPAAAVAAGVFWIWPPFNLHQLTEHMSFYAADVFYCALLLLLALRIVERPDRARVGVFGLVLGLAFWETSQIVPIAVPVIAWTIWRRPRCLRHAWLAAVLAIVGALPWLVWNARHDWASLGVHGDLHTFARSLRLFASPIMPMTVGLRAPFAQTLLIPSSAVTYLVYVGLVALFAYGAYRARGRDRLLLYVTVVVFPFLYAIDRRTSFIEGWPQYTVVLTPVLALLFAQVATRYARGVAVLALAFVVTSVGLHHATVQVKEPNAEPGAPRNLGPLISTLDRLHLDRVYANYWIAYRLDFETQERVIAVENRFAGVTFAGGQAIPTSDSNVRWPAYEPVVQAARHGFVFFEQTARSVAIVPELVRHGYRPHLVGPFVVYAPPPGVGPSPAARSRSGER